LCFSGVGVCGLAKCLRTERSAPQIRGCLREMQVLQLRCGLAQEDWLVLEVDKPVYAHKRRRQRPESLASRWRCTCGVLDHASPVQLSNEAPGRPGSCIFRLAGDGVSSCLDSRILQRCRRLKFRVAPLLRFSCIASDEASGCPGSCIFRLRRR